MELVIYSYVLVSLEFRSITQFVRGWMWGVDTK